MEKLGYPWKTIVGLSVAAALSLYGTLEFYEEQMDRNQVRKDPYQIGWQVRRAGPLAREVPPTARLGYISDRQPDPAELLALQYAIAPRLLVGNAPHDYVLGDFSKSLDYAQFGRARGLTLVKQLPEGLVLFRKSL